MDVNGSSLRPTLQPGEPDGQVCDSQRFCSSGMVPMGGQSHKGEGESGDLIPGCSVDDYFFIIDSKDN